MGNIKTLAKDLIKGTSYSVRHVVNKDIESTISKKGVDVRKNISLILRCIYALTSKYKLIVDSREKISNNTKIYVINHRQSDDIVLGAKLINDSGYVVFGNKNLVLDTTNGLGLWANGMILLDRGDKESRTSTYDKMRYVINSGGNIIIWAEGYWNLDDNGLGDEKHLPDDHNSENWLIQDINLGVIRLAKETGSSIVPAVLHYDETDKKMCYGKTGKEIKVGKDDDIFSKKDEIVTSMQTMYYELMEKYSSYNRGELEKNHSMLESWEELKKELISACDIPSIGYKLDLADEKLIGKAKVVKKITTNEEAFEHLDRIDYNVYNSYLLSKRLTGKR